MKLFREENCKTLWDTEHCQNNGKQPFLKSSVALLLSFHLVDFIGLDVPIRR